VRSKRQPTRPVDHAVLAFLCGILTFSPACSTGLEPILCPYFCGCYGSVVAGLIDDPNFYDPNDYDPNCLPQDPPPCLEGAWESTDDTREAAWDNPDSPLAIALEAHGNPFGGVGTSPAGVRSFVAFDANNRLLLNMYCDPVENVIYIDDPGGDPFVGTQFFLQEDGSFQVQDFVMMDGDMGGGLYVKAIVNVVVTPDEDGDSLAIEQDFVAEVSAIQDLPTDPPIPDGETVVYTVHATLQAVRSDWPGILFPDAAWEITTRE
jgi:hypothetical protein